MDDHGRDRRLRNPAGKGSGHVDSSTGSDDATGPRAAFTDTWTGVVDFDAAAPTGAISRVGVVRPRTSHAAWTARIRFRAHDNDRTNPVRFSATVTADPFFAVRNGRVKNGNGSLTVAFHPAKGTRRLRIVLELADPWDNTRTLRKNVLLR